MKITKCRFCGESELPKMKKGTDNMCKKCDNEKGKRWRASNKLKVKEASKKWAERNKDKMLLISNRGKHTKWITYIEFIKCKECNNYIVVSDKKKALFKL